MFPDNDIHDWEFEDDDDCIGDIDCPNCGREYDEVDFEYQICHHCKYNNNASKH